MKCKKLNKQNLLVFIICYRKKNQYYKNRNNIRVNLQFINVSFYQFKKKIIQQIEIIIEQQNIIQTIIINKKNIRSQLNKLISFSLIVVQSQSYIQLPNLKNIRQSQNNKQMQRDLLKAIKQYFYSFQQLSGYKITQKTLSDGYIFMQFLSIINYTYFDTAQITKPLIQNKSKHNISSKHHNNTQPQDQTKFNNNHTSNNNPFKPFQISYTHNNNNYQQLDLSIKIKNWKILIKKIKQYFLSQHQKGIKYGDIDIVDISKNQSLQQLSKVFQLLLCVVANCNDKNQYITKIIDLQQSTQLILANLMQKGLQMRICTLQTQQKWDLIQQLQLKQQQNISLYVQIDRLEQMNKQLIQRVQQYQKSANRLQYQKQRLIRFNKKNSLANNQLYQYNNQCQQINGQNNNSDQQQYINSIQNNYNRQDYCQQSSVDNDISLISNNQYYNNNKITHHHIIQSLKNKIIKQQQAHQHEIQQLYNKINLLEQQLKSYQHYQQLLIIYQQKYQQALTYVQKVSLYQKQKNKIYQSIIEKDIIIDQLKNTISEINQKLLSIEQQKIDLQLLLAKKNHHLLNKHNNNNLPQVELKKLSTYGCELSKNNHNQLLSTYQTNTNHNRQISQQTDNNNKQYNTKLSLSLYPYQDEQLFNSNSNNKIQQLQIKIDSQSLSIKRLQRKQKQLTKHNKQLKSKLQKIKKIQQQNKKLSHIIVQLHTRKDQQKQILVSCLYQTFKEYDFKFHKLIGNNIKTNNKNNHINSNNYILNNNQCLNNIQHRNSNIGNNNVQHRNSNKFNQLTNSNHLLNNNTIHKSIFNMNNNICNMNNTCNLNHKKNSIRSNSSRRSSNRQQSMVIIRRKQNRNPSIRIQNQCFELNNQYIQQMNNNNQILQVSITNQATQNQLLSNTHNNTNNFIHQ